MPTQYKLFFNNEYLVIKQYSKIQNNSLNSQIAYQNSYDKYISSGVTIIHRVFSALSASFRGLSRPLRQANSSNCPDDKG